MNKHMVNRRTLVVAAEIHAELIALAKAEGRSVYWLTNRLLTDALKMDAVLKAEPTQEALGGDESRSIR